MNDTSNAFWLIQLDLASYFYIYPTNST